jgi:hypothetical protein
MDGSGEGVDRGGGSLLGSGDGKGRPAAACKDVGCGDATRRGGAATGVLGRWTSTDPAAAMPWYDDVGIANDESGREPPIEPFTGGWGSELARGGPVGIDGRLGEWR